MSEIEDPKPSSSEETDEKEDICPLPAKRSKISDKAELEKLEHRLGGILCCAVCLDLPQVAVYQCSNGHLMCVGCFMHILADASLRSEMATCPNCRIEITKQTTTRNLAVEKAISELPSECRHCSYEFPRHTLTNHEQNVCEQRLSGCKYECIGCEWKGPFNQVVQHEEVCEYPNRNGSSILSVIVARDKMREEEMALYNHVFELFSTNEKISFNGKLDRELCDYTLADHCNKQKKNGDILIPVRPICMAPLYHNLQLKPYRTTNLVDKLYYESSRFCAFNVQWVVKAYVNNDQPDPTKSCERSLTYQLFLRATTSSPLAIKYLVLRGPHGDASYSPRLYSYTFAFDGNDDNEAPPTLLPLVDCKDANRLLANKSLYFRLIMFLV